MNDAAVGKEYWRSLDELADAPEFQRWVKDEFPGMAGELVAPATRRGFLKVMAASLGMAGLTACRWPKEQILPFAERPQGRTPGVPQQFATAFELWGAGIGLVVTSVDGRPVKVEGNPLHPGSLGAANAWAQASVLELYDPDRSQHPVRRSGAQESAATWDDFLAFAAPRFAALEERKGRGLAVLAEESSSPTVSRVKGRFLEAFPEASWTEWEPLSRDREREGTRLLFGEPFRPVVDLSKADVIVSLADDFLFLHPNALRQARDFAAGRRAHDGKMNRLHVAESTLTLTGAAADHRVPVRPSELPRLALQLAKALALLGVELPGGIGSGLGDAGSPVEEVWAARAAQDLAGAKGRAIVLAGSELPAAVHALVQALNVVLGATAGPVRYVAADGAARKASHVEGVTALAASMQGGQVETLLILGGNPVFDAPAEVDFRGALSKVTAIHLSLFDNETSRRCGWHVPRAHPLETWGDTRAWDGTIAFQQPLIEALYGGRSVSELLAVLLGDPGPSGHDLVRATFQTLGRPADPEAAWRRTLHDGVLAGSAYVPLSAAPAVRAGSEAARAISALSALSAPSALTAPSALGASRVGGLEVLFTPDASVFDGRFANNAWLQELPDPLTRMTWDNAACVSPAEARRLGVAHGDVVKLTLEGRHLEIAMYVLPGMAPGTVVLPLGYGRTAAGRVGSQVGFATTALRTGRTFWSGGGLQLEKTGRTYQLACTQDHHAIDTIGFEERGKRVGQLVREGSLPAYRKDPGFARKMGEEPASLALFTELTYKGEHQWGMAIDLSACIGCNACSIACQAENNIPVVGKDQVARGREMHWIRVDRYFAGDENRPEAVFQPLTCQHCENAPCESVCPVAATSHSDEGVNQMIYNRCVGTRYCSNNCPYKVRRFNFYENFPDVPQVTKMVFNPEVTIRSRGVMEKCTFCIQRIEIAKIAAKNERRPLLDGEIVPACAQTCPTEAIVFGDLKAEGSRVARLHQDERSYALLGELNVKPRNRYLARLKNPVEGREPA